MIKQAEACKRKWKNLRDSYTKYLRSYRTGTKTSKKYQYWAHADHMDFLRPFQGPGRSSQSGTRLEDIYSEFSAIKQDVSYDLSYEVLEKSSTENISQNIGLHNAEQQHSNEILTPSTPLNKGTTPSTTNTTVDERNLIKIKQIELDACSMFFLSLAKSVRAMPKKYQADVKMRCMKFVSDVEMELENAMFDADNSSSNLSLSLNNKNLLKNRKFNGQQYSHHGPLSSSLSSQQQQLSHQHQIADNSEHFLYVMSPSRVEAMIDISSDDDLLDSKN